MNQMIGGQIRQLIALTASLQCRPLQLFRKVDKQLIQSPDDASACLLWSHVFIC
jgi:hypothetical protein